MPPATKKSRISGGNRQDEASAPPYAQIAGTGMELSDLIESVRLAAVVLHSDRDDAFRSMEAAHRALLQLSALVRATKQEIATLSPVVNAYAPTGTACRELDEVLCGTEGAANSILDSAEKIDHAARALSQTTLQKTTPDQEKLGTIRNEVTHIFEACGFQDMTGQRIARITGNLAEIEECIQHLIAIWGGDDAFSGLTPRATGARQDAQRVAGAGPARALRGPARHDDIDQVDQTAIDALFAGKN